MGIVYDLYLSEEKLPALCKVRETTVESVINDETAVSVINKLFNLERKAEEYSCVVGLDAKGNILGAFEVGHGTVSNALVGTREIFIRLLLVGAIGFIHAHNHPSGDSSPSSADIEVAKTLQKAGDLMGISLTDSIIIGNGNYCSFRNRGYL